MFNANNNNANNNNDVDERFNIIRHSNERHPFFYFMSS